MDFSFGYLVNQGLYALSGFFFGTFCCRMGVFVYRYLYQTYKTGSIVRKLFLIPAYLILLFCLWIIFPLILYGYTQLGGFVMLVTIMYFSNYARKVGSFTQVPQKEPEKLDISKRKGLKGTRWEKK